MTRLEEIEARLKAATPAPWAVDGMDAGHSKYEMNWWVTAGDSGDVVCDMDGLQRSGNEQVAKDDGRDDAYFIANAPGDVAYLLDLVKRQQRALQAVCDEVDRSVAFDQQISGAHIMTGIHAEMEGAVE